MPLTVPRTLMGVSTPFPLSDPHAVDRLGADLRAAGYDVNGVAEQLGPAHRQLAAGSRWPARLACATDDARSVLIRLFLLDDPISPAQAVCAFPTLGVDAALAQQVLVAQHDGLRAGLDVRPHADHTRDYLVVSDCDRGPGTIYQDHVLGIGAASLTLAQATVRQPVARALDLGTGCGIQALHLAGHADTVVATDTNPRALALAQASAQLSGCTLDLRAGHLFEPVAGEKFDLIVSNPPFVISAGEQEFSYRDSGIAGDGLCAQLLAEIEKYLRPGAQAQILANWLITSEDPLATPTAWLANTGLDALICLREIADPVDYVCLWLADAGQGHTAGPSWLSYLQSARTLGIGMGLICLRRPNHGTGRIDGIELLGDSAALTGDDIANYLTARDIEQAHTDQELLASVITLSPAAVLASQARLASTGWQQYTATVTGPRPGAHLEVDQVGAALLAGCQGIVPLGILIKLLADSHGLDEVALTAQVLTVIRYALVHGLATLR